jgi:hypothetical protein
MKPLIPPKSLPLLGLWKSGQKTTAHFPTSPTTITSTIVSPKRGHLYLGEKGTFLLWVDRSMFSGADLYFELGEGKAVKGFWELIKRIMPGSLSMF